MKFSVHFLTVLLLISASANTAIADSTPARQDPRAVEVLSKMSAFTACLDRLVISGEVHADARLGAGMVISNPSEIEVNIDRPGSLYISSFDGLTTKEIYIHNGQLTVFDSEHNYYARTKVPEDIEQAMQFALEEFEIETPLMDLILSDVSIHLLTGQETITYLTDKSRIRGVDCHHLVVRGLEIDLQLWVEEGDRPVPRKVLMTSKWESGSPRHLVFLDWSPRTDFDQTIFEFNAPEGSSEIKFIGNSKPGNGGE
jgi:hypothetical protein